MAKENVKEEINEVVEKSENVEFKADENVKSSDIAMQIHDEYEVDAFERQRNRDQNLDYHKEEDVVVYSTPFKVQRFASNTNSERVYYNYAVGYKAKINGKEIAQVVQLQPSERRADIYDLLDAIFGDSDTVVLNIVRTARTVTANGVSKITYTYAPQVRAADEDGVDFTCALVPSGSTGRVKFSNLVSKLKSMGAVE